MHEWISTLLEVILVSLRFGVEIHAQNSGIHSQKNDSNHCFGVDSTYNMGVDSFPKKVTPNMTPNREDFHSTAKRVLFLGQWTWSSIMLLINTDHLILKKVLATSPYDPGDLSGHIRYELMHVWSILPYSGKRKQVTKVTFLVKEQNKSVISTDVNGI